MQTDSHYYAVLAFCRACGFSKEEALKTAYASQYVDDASINHIEIDATPDEIKNIEYEIINDKPCFFNMATAHSYFKIKTFNYCAMINNTAAFHFVPACQGEDFPHKMCCYEESPVIMKIIEDVVQEGDSVKLGLVLHPYADGFAHHGFSGILSKINDIKDLKPLVKVHDNRYDQIRRVAKRFFGRDYEYFFDRGIPAYGHAQTLEYPDIPYLKFEYAYDYSDKFSEVYKKTTVNNPQRYIKAFQKIKKVLERYLEHNLKYFDHKIQFNNFELLFNSLVFPGSLEKRIANWIKLIIEQGFFSRKELTEFYYDQQRYLKSAFANYETKKFDHRKVGNVRLADNFPHSDWYKFYLGVKWYKKKFHAYCKENSLDIPL